MADQPLLMNFSIGNEAIHVKTKFKGGRWQERRGRQKSQRPTGVNAELVTERPAKKPRLGNDPKQPGRKNQSYNGPPPGGVISSLFSFNPEVTTVSEEIKDELPAQPSNAPLPDGIDTFTSLGLNSSIAAHLLTKMDIKNPTAIQKSAVPQLISESSDAFIQAETGSGKTLAYLLPLVHQLMQLSKTNKQDQGGSDQLHRDSGLFAIILAPTRELSKQISTVLESLLGCARWIVSGTVVGGEKKKSEKARLRKGLNILVATPGRLVDHLANTEVLNVSNVRWLVLDEGDRLMELGFEEDIKKIIKKLETPAKVDESIVPGLPRRRMTILCSATMRSNVHKLGEISLQDAIHIQPDLSHEKEEIDEPAAIGDDHFQAPAQLQQSYIVTPPKQRLVTLHALLTRSFSRKGSVMKAIVFFTCADSVDFHYDVFARNDAEQVKTTSDAKATSMDQKSSDLPTTCRSPILSSKGNPNVFLYKLYGNLTQQMRTATLRAFSRDKSPSVLLCTDVASRGLDLPSIDLVVEYDPAFSAEEHLHRIGRTARAGQDGRAVMFLMPGPEEGYIPILRKGFKDNRVNGSTAEDILRKAFAPAVAAQSKETWEDRATEWQLEVERWAQSDTKTAELARKAYISHVRAYATHTASERQYFDVKELHLGHLAKAFALRDKPSALGRGDKRDQDNAKDWKRRGDSNVNANEIDAARSSAVEPSDAARQMKKALRAMNPASEFNIA